MTSTAAIRDTFLNYFEKNDHRIVPSSPLVPHNDPTLMFTNSGMVQFKNLFTGQEKRDYQRAVTSQKVVRAGGKHNDLDNVGHTARHHTFFEMLGNFSFGDYFKEQAIHHAWTLLTQHYGLPKDKLLVTIYHTDEEARNLWKKIANLSDDRIIPIATSDNFWSMGDTGPCGPCSEIFYDHGDKIFGGPPGSADQDGDRFIEIWNLVFMQYERFLDGKQTDLPRPSIDTGMGLERIAAVLQGKHDNYDIDLMRALIEASAQVSHDDPDGPNNVSHRVIADHLRSACFLIAEGVLPSNEGRGYVLRRIMRRGMRHAHMIGNQDPVLYRLVPSLIQQMGGHYNELKQAESLISETLHLEEKRFKKTIDRGLRLLEEETNKLADRAPLAGDVAFKLYDTYGFPLDLTQDILRAQGRSVDIEGFNSAMTAQKAVARASWAGSGEQATSKLWFELKEQHGSTEFLGYSKLEADAKVLALVIDEQQQEQLSEQQTGLMICNQTPFYAESGGQQGDTGLLIADDGATQATITDTQKVLGSLWVHKIAVTKGALKAQSTVRLVVNNERRQALARHHSATHLLHEALREQLGTHVAQRGSLVAAERLRFDFSHNTAISAQDLKEIEKQVNARVFENSTVHTRIMSLEEAQEQGAMALFGEKYGDEVRVVMMGKHAIDERKPYSMELCGGTHVRATGEIGLIKIIGEENLAAGTRRIEAVAGLAALDYISNQEQLLQASAQAIKVSKQDLPLRVLQLADERKVLDRELNELRKKIALGSFSADTSTAQESINGITFIARQFEDVPARELKGMADNLMQGHSKAVVALISSVEGKASIVTAVSADLCARISAVDLVKLAAAALGGSGGGGRQDMAQAGGPNAADASKALDALRAHLKSQ